MRDHQKRDIDDRDGVGGAQLAGHRGKVGPNRVVIVQGQVAYPHDVECDDEQPVERPRPHGQKREDRKQPGCQVAVCGEGGKGARQMSADDAGNHKDESEESEAVQGRDGALRFDPIHRFEARPDVGAKAEQPGDIAKDELHGEDVCRRHVDSHQRLVAIAWTMACDGGFARCVCSSTAAGGIGTVWYQRRSCYGTYQYQCKEFP